MLGAEPVKRADPRAGQRIDPTDPLNYSVVSIRNDTTGPVALNDCKGAYCHVPLPVRLSPGQQFTEGAAFGASGSNMTSWKVTGGTVLGYVAVDPPPRKRDGLIFDVSRASTDRHTPTPAADTASQTASPERSGSGFRHGRRPAGRLWSLGGRRPARYARGTAPLARLGAPGRSSRRPARWRRGPRTHSARQGRVLGSRTAPAGLRRAHPSRKARAAEITLRWASSASCSSSPLLSTSNGALSSS